MSEPIHDDDDENGGNETEVSTNFLNMTDEEIRNYDPTKQPVAEAEVTTRSDANASELPTGVVDEADATAVVDPLKDDTTSEAVSEEKESTAETTATSEHKDFYDQVTAPFKANGTTMQVKSAEDAIALMQMGANYNKKMGELKQHRPLIKMLEEHSLLDEGKLSFLIDLHNKNPNAIAKLIKESELDIYDVDSQEKADSYAPTVVAPNQESLALQDVMDELKDQPNYPRVLNAVAYEFDEDSRNAVARNPVILRDLIEHASNGIYDQIMAYISSERVFGRMQGSLLQMYQQAGNTLHAAGKLVGTKPAAVVPVVVKGNNAALDNQRKAAGAGGKPAPAKSVPIAVNPLAMTDKEFAEYAKTIV